MAERLSKAARERAAAQKALAQGELKARETYTAKQVAMRCGTDAKTMRKFFRSKYSTVEPVGQGGRYEFAASDLPKIKKEFNAWRRKSEAHRPTPRTPIEPAQVQEVLNQHDDPDISLGQLADAIDRANNEPYDNYGPNDHFFLDDAEPTEEDLAELEDLNLEDNDV